uniref:Fibrous sheath CABYR-binding protein n=1 Tax=Phallusia mammillata TaxID=59560 RepID=A0A6F9DDT2_9ASCI|nr:fibrous sheath CABYR-binding protein [Phallusia mammillata]
MGQKSSKKTDLYVTDDVTHCKLSDGDVTKYVGRAREYTAVDVIVEKPKQDESPDPKNAEGSPKKKTPENPDSIIQLLHRAHRKSYNLAFVIPRVKGSRPTNLNRNSLVEEDPEDSEAVQKEGDLTHTVFLWRPKVKARLKKEMSLKKMEAKKTFLNMMMDIQHKWIFSVKEYESDVAKIESGEYVAKLQEMISNEASKGGRLLSVMRVENDVTTGNGVSNGGGSEPGSPNQTTKKGGKLTLRMVFLHRNSDKAKQRFLYNVKCVSMNCTEEKIKVKKKQKTKLPRDTNITWSENWLELFEEDSRITEVINVGEMSKSGEDYDAKNKKKMKKREFQVMTLCFHEKPVAKDNNDNDGVTGDDEDDDDEIYETPMRYESLVREVWAPIDDSVQQNLESEAERFGENGWELCTVLVTSHVRMKQDGSEFRKCAIFFQRPKGEFVPDNERTQSTDNLLQAGNVEIEESNAPETEMLEPENIPPTSPKEKVERFGVALMPQVDLNQAKLRTAKPSPQKTKANDALISGLAGVQLKKVNREEAKKPDVSKDVEEKQAIMPQVKLRKTEPKQEKKLEVEEKEVPWANSLERKREAVMKSEDKAKTPEPVRKKEEGSDEIARKLDEIKEKRAQRQNRISIHKEEEKRKSLEAEKRKSMDAEKRKSLEEEKRKSQIAVASVIAVTDTATQPKLPDTAVEETTQNAQTDELPPPVIEDLPPPVVDEVPSLVVEEVPTLEDDKLPPSVAQEESPPVVDELPPPVAEEVIPPVVDELPPPVPKEPDNEVSLNAAEVQTNDVDVSVVEKTYAPEEITTDLPIPPQTETEITEETLEDDVTELENTLAEFEQQIDESSASAELEEDIEAPTIDVVTSEVVEEKPKKDETSDRDENDVELPLPLSLEPPKSALSSLHLPSPPPPDQEEASSPVPDQEPETLNEDQPCENEAPHVQQGDVTPLPTTQDHEDTPKIISPEIKDAVSSPEVEEVKPLTNGDVQTPSNEETPSVVEESENSDLPLSEEVLPTNGLPPPPIEVEPLIENLTDPVEEPSNCDLPPPVQEEVKAPEPTLDDLPAPDPPLDEKSNDTQEFQPSPPPEELNLPPPVEFPPPTENSESLKTDPVNAPDSSSLKDSSECSKETEHDLPLPPPSQEEESLPPPEEKPSDDLPPPADIPQAEESTEVNPMPKDLPTPISASPEKSTGNETNGLPPPPALSIDDVNDKKE